MNMENLTQWNDKLMGAPSGVLVLFLCLAAGYVWKMIRVLPNRFIPLIVMLTGAIIFVLLNWATPTVPLIAKHFVIGFIIGFVAWLCHNKFLKHIERKLGLCDEKDAVEPNNEP